MEPEKGLPTAGRWCWQCCETLLQKVEQGTWLVGRQTADVVSRPRPMPWESADPKVDDLIDRRLKLKLSSHSTAANVQSKLEEIIRWGPRVMPYSGTPSQT